MKKRLLPFFFMLLTLPVAAQDERPRTDTYTYQKPSGNRFVEGQGVFPNIASVDFSLEGRPMWVIGRSSMLPVEVVQRINPDCKYSASWAVVLVEDRRPNRAVWCPPNVRDIYYNPPNMMPLFYETSSDLPDMLLGFVGLDQSPLTHATHVYQDERTYVLFISEDYDLARTDDYYLRLPLQALPDARIVVNDAEQIALYTGADDQRYTHGVLGDSIEATELTVLEIIDNQLEIISTITLPEPDVFEGISPIWADVDEDGMDDLITTVSNAQVGAQIRVYRVDGSLLATGPAIGLGGRWRHQLAFGPFGPNGESELVDVLTPHIGGVVEFYRLNGDQLEIVASLPGYTSHVIGTRNLDMAVGGDFNGDGQPEIVLPTQDRQFIAGLQHTGQGIIEEVWRLPLEGRLSTNLSAVTLPDNTLALAAGTEEGRLRIWLSG